MALVMSLGGLAGLVGRADARPAPTYAGDWDGHTNQDKFVVFRVNDDGRLRRFRIKFDIHGDHCVLHTTALCRGARLIRGDEFRVHIDDRDGAATFVGRFIHRNVAKGTYKATLNVHSGCAGQVKGTWRASR